MTSTSQSEAPVPLYIAVDLGASSGRVIVGDLAPDTLRLEEVARFSHPMRKRGGHLRWDMGRILREVKGGLRAAGALARGIGRPIATIGVDTFGVDYGLLDAEGKLLEEPICYRDDRTSGTMARVFERVARDEIYRRTGIQFMVFNTIFQLFEHLREGIPPNAHRILMMPDVINHALCGAAVIEYSNASTTQMLDARARDWDRELLTRLGLPVQLLPSIVPSGTDLGPLRPEVAEELELANVRVVAPATHDTGSAVAGAPLQPGWAYISSGTWSLVGIERKDPLINAEVARENFTNEGGVYGTIRFLKNCMGLWLFEECKRQWEQAGLWVEYESFLPQVSALRESPGLICPDDQRLFNPPDMLEAIAQQMRDTGQNPPSDPVAVTKVILDSLALRYARIVATIERLTGQPITGIQIVGGGSQNEYLSRATAEAAQRPVLCGPVEATAIGNLIVQAITHGRFRDLEAARRHVEDHTVLQRYAPMARAEWDGLRTRYREIEARILDT